MLDFPLWKRLSLWAITLALAAISLPSIGSLAGLNLPDWAAEPQINLGLDLAGGSHILLEADPAQVERQRFETMEEAVRTALGDASDPIRIGEVSTAEDRLTFMLDDASQVDRARELMLPLINGAGLVREWDLAVVDGSRFVLTQTDQGLTQAVDDAMDSAADVIRRRIDDLGTREPTIIRQGSERIVVQVPGLDDPQALKNLLGQTARLEFKLVDPRALPADVQAGVATNPGTEIVPYGADSEFAGQFEAVFRLGGIRGDSLTGAQQSYDQRTNEPVVSIQFDAQGGARFAQLSTQNVGRRFAIILDDEVISAPQFNEPILSGAAQISGGFTVEKANELAIALRSGALPVDLKVVEERTVGPDLGADSIKAGVFAMGVGTLALIAFMLVTYGRFGVYTCAALIINALIILGIMAGLGATLTLPGIAGFVLTIGAAVDANVLINERIREELRRGRRVVAAVENGYKEASRAIFDANITNVIAALLMFFIGSGPVKGFAVVLIIGIGTSVFTAVWLTRMWVAGWLRRARPSDITL